MIKHSKFRNSSTGHCCENQGANSIRINIGDHLYQNGDEDSYLEIKQIIIHPDYDGDAYNGLPYDFCMVQTKEKMVIDGVKTQVACFPEANQHANGNEAECWTAGWGDVQSGFPKNPLQLQTLKVNLYDDETCFNHALNHKFSKKPKLDHYEGDYGEEYNYPELPPIPDDSYYENDINNMNYTEEHQFYNSDVEFCAGHYNVTTDTYTAEASSCFGDSGGPLGLGEIREGYRTRSKKISATRNFFSMSVHLL